MSHLPHYRKRARHRQKLREQETRRVANQETRRKADAVEQALAGDVLLSISAATCIPCGAPIPQHHSVSWRCPCGVSAIEIDTSVNPPRVSVTGPIHTVGGFIFSFYERL